MDALTFRVGDGEYAIDLQRVQEVSMGVPVTRVPGAPFAVRGVSNLRGNVVPMIDLSLRLAGPGVVGTGRAAVLFVEARIGAEVAIVGLMVDAVRTVLSIAESEIVERSAVPSLASAEIVSGLAKMEGRLVPILDVDALLSLEELTACRTRPAAEAPEAENRVGGRSDSPAPEKTGAAAGPDGAPATVARGAEAWSEPPTATAPQPSAPERPRPTGPARTPPAAVARPIPAAAPAVPAAEPPVPLAPRQSPAPVARQPSPPHPPAAAGMPGSELQVRAPQPPARSIERSVPAAGALRVDEPTVAREAAGKIPEGRVGRWSWIAGALTMLGLVALAALYLCRPADGRPEMVRGTRVEGAGLDRDRPRQGIDRPDLRHGDAASSAAAREAVPGPAERAEAPRPARSGPAAPGEVVHEVQRGDTLWDLSGRYYGDPHRWPAIWDVNRDLISDPDLILPNEQLRIPAGKGPAGGAGEAPAR